ncbi:MAG: sigma-54-dependent Fis family transcriptional regulator [Spirochaetes bacterium]|nr:MAG: sigma-54-dependent Fis family transcriptional regulator [Spirochaetota bacterium]
MSRVLIIDDEPGIRNVLKDILEDENYTVFTAEEGLSGLSLVEKESIDLVILDIWLPNMGGIDVLREIKQSHPEVEVIVISGHANIDMAVKAVKLGAFDFLEKPLSMDKVITLVKNALAMEDLKKENRQLKYSLFMEDPLIGSSPAMKKIRTLIDQSAASDARILIMGENGTGKELVAREIHKKSRRCDGPFVTVNCAAIPDTLLESELFGHEKGAFTGAIARRRGKFEMADEGTLFLDEVADMSSSAQAKVLRVIQELKFERIGGEKSISVDVRLIAATNKNIQEEIKKQLFREDLYFRLNVIPIIIPPLRERPEDLRELTNYFMEKFKPQKNSEKRTISNEGMKILEDYTWPGNVRELKNFIERINVMSDEEIISPETAHYLLGEKIKEERSWNLKEFESMKLNEAKDLFEKKLLTLKLSQNNFNISKTAEALGIYPSNLHGKIKKLGIKIQK